MVELKVCIGTSCHLNGAHNIVMSFQHLIEQYSLHDKVNMTASFCMRKCSHCDVSVSVNGVESRITPESAREFFKNNVIPLTK